MSPRRFLGTRSTTPRSPTVRLRPADPAAGDEDAMSVAYDLHAERAFAVGWSILGTAVGAQDALTGAMLDLGRRRRHDPSAPPSAAWVLGRASAHALRGRRLGRGYPGRLSGLTEIQCQVLALACAGRVSRTDIGRELRLSSTAVAAVMTEALRALGASAPVRGRRAARPDGAGR